MLDVGTETVSVLVVDDNEALRTRSKTKVSA